MRRPHRVLFVTVGTTALSAAQLGDAGKDAGMGAADLRRRAMEFKDAGDEEAPPDLACAVLDAHDDVWKGGWRLGQPIFESRYQTSAEMVSSWYALRLQGNGQLFNADRDQIVLLSSETPQGRFCAEVNKELARRYLFSPPADREDSACVEVIKGLEAKEHGFETQIVDSLEEIWSRHNARDETIVNITGGFKGTVPALTWRCIHSYENCWMFYTHESMDRAERITFFKDTKPPQHTPIIVARR